ncbi:unnamed protein product [Agarophyton chilense]
MTRRTFRTAAPARSKSLPLLLLLLLSLTAGTRAVPTLRSPLSRGIFDFFTPSESTPLASASPSASISASVADAVEAPFDSEPEDESLFATPSASLSPLPSPTAQPVAFTPEPSAAPTETEQPTETSVAAQDAQESVPEQTPLALPTLPPRDELAGLADGDQLDQFDPELLFAPDDTQPLDQGKAVDSRSSGATGLASTASTGISVVALVAVAVAVLAPALLIYYGIRRRRAAGFNAMPPTHSDTSTYRAAPAQFSVGE